jgi:hypothetical protein
VAKRLHILRTVRLTREFVSSRVPWSMARACQTSVGTYAPSPHTARSSLPRQLSHLLRTSDGYCHRLEHRVAVGHEQYTTPEALHTSATQRCSVKANGFHARDKTCGARCATCAANATKEMQHAICSMQLATESNKADMQNASCNGPRTALHTARRMTSASNIPAQNATDETQ